MVKSLVIVESPAKCKTIKKYLGSQYDVLASYGHVRDLVPKSGAVDPNNHFAMRYELVDRNIKHLDAIKKKLKSCQQLILATDPDREGEAISWHILEYLKQENALKGIEVERVVFNEITKKAILEAVSQPRQISMSLVNAQQARRALDYLVGFNLSPLLWKKISPGLSAGRVQSPSLRLICEREDEINAFVSKEYWSIEADLNHDQSSQNFKAKLTEYEGKKIQQFSIVDEKSANSIKNSLLNKFGSTLPVYNIERKKRHRYPSPPFITSTLQQESSRKLGFSSQKTMKVAQTLYEGINLGTESIGLITYMRTDSVNLSQEALGEIRSLISQQYGKDYLPKEIVTYKTKSKNAQEAHEAIRPTSAMRLPEEVKPYLSSDQFLLYELIWKRTVACQMSPAVINTVAVDMGIEGLHSFRANGSSIAFPGFINLYIEELDSQIEQKNKVKGEDKLLPPLEIGDLITLNAIIPHQHFTEPPPRYTEASLIKTLEEYGIGRPSTYASIVSTLQNREYVTMKGKNFVPTDVGQIVSRFLVDHFIQYVNYQFTANLEDDLDAISRGEKDWIPLLDSFWKPFNQLCVEKDEGLTRADVIQSRELGVDPKTNKPVSVRIGRFGAFAQIGVKEDEEKPQFAPLRSNQRLDTITLEEALELFKLPRLLGEDLEGNPIKANIGRFGPYLQWNNKFISLKEDDPYDIDHARAMEVIENYKIAQQEKTIKVFENVSKISGKPLRKKKSDPTDDTMTIQILNGRFGPYVTNGEKNFRIPKEVDPKQLTLEECLVLLEKAPIKSKKSSQKATTKNKVKKEVKTSKRDDKKIVSAEKAKKKVIKPKNSSKKKQVVQ